MSIRYDKNKIKMSVVIDILNILFFVDQEPGQNTISSYSNKYQNITTKIFNLFPSISFDSTI